MNAKPVTLHELHPADHGTEGRVDLIYLYSLAVASGDEVPLDIAVAEAGQHPAVLAGLTLQRVFLPPEVQPLDDDGLGVPR